MILYEKTDGRPPTASPLLALSLGKWTTWNNYGALVWRPARGYTASSGALSMRVVETWKQPYILAICVNDWIFCFAQNVVMSEQQYQRAVAPFWQAAVVTLCHKMLSHSARRSCPILQKLLDSRVFGWTPPEALQTESALIHTTLIIWTTKYESQTLSFAPPVCKRWVYKT